MQRSIRDVWVSGWVHRTTIEWTRRIWCTHISFLPYNWINVCSLVNPLNSWEFVWVGSLTEANEFNSSLMCCISVHLLVAHLSLWFFSGYFRLLGTVIERHTTPLVWFILEFRLHLPLLSSPPRVPASQSSHCSVRDDKFSFQFVTTHSTRTHALKAWHTKHSPPPVCHSCVNFILSCSCFSFLPLVLQVHELSASLPTLCLAAVGFMEHMMSIECLQRWVNNLLHSSSSPSCST